MGNPFKMHHAAAGKAFALGDTSKAMHHIGHMMKLAKSSAKPAPTIAPAPVKGPPLPAPTASAEDMNAAPSAIGAPLPTTPAKPAFNKSRFGAIKAKAAATPFGRR